MPVLGFGTLIPDAAATISATRDALEAGFDTWSRYYTKYFRPCSRLLPRISPGTLWSGFIATSRVSLSRLLIAAQSQNRCLPHHHEAPRQKCGGALPEPPRAWKPIFGGA